MGTNPTDQRKSLLTFANTEENREQMRKAIISLVKSLNLLCNDFHYPLIFEGPNFLPRRISSSLTFGKIGASVLECMDVIDYFREWGYIY